MATGRKPGRVPGAIASQSHGGAFGQQQQQPQQQQPHAPFGNVDPNVANGTNNQQNSFSTSNNNTSIIDPHSSTFNLRECNLATNVPGYVPKPGTPGGSGFDFNPNAGALPSKNPFSPVYNDCALPEQGGGTMVGYAGSLFTMPSTTPANTQELLADGYQKEARVYHCDPDLNKNSEGKLWASHAPFIQSEADQTPDETKSAFTDDLKRRQASQNPFSQLGQAQQPQQQQQQQQPQSLFFGGPSQSFGQQQQQPHPQSAVTNFGQPQAQSLFFGGSSQPFGQQQQQPHPQAVVTNFDQPQGQSSFFGGSHQSFGQQQQQHGVLAAPLSPKDSDMSLNPPDPNTEMGNTEEQIDSLDARMYENPTSTFHSSNLQRPSDNSPSRSSSTSSNTSSKQSTLPPSMAPSKGTNSLNLQFGQTNISNESTPTKPQVIPVNAADDTPKAASTNGTLFKPFLSTPTKFQFTQSTHLANEDADDTPKPAPTKQTLFKSFISTPTASQFTHSTHLVNTDGDDTPKPASTKEPLFKPLFSTSATSQPSISFTNSKAPPSSQSGGFVFSAKSAPNANASQSGGFVFSAKSAPDANASQSGGMFPSLNSAPIAKTPIETLEASLGPRRTSSANQQTENLMPPTCPKNFSANQRQEYITHYRIRSLNHAFKKHIDSALIFPVDSGVLEFYHAKMHLILLDGRLSVQNSGTKRKSLGDAHDDNGSGPNKRISTNGSFMNGDSPLTSSSNTNNSKRKATEEISKGSDGNGSSDTVKKARGNLSYPALPQISETARLFAKAAKGNASGSTSAPAQARVPTFNMEPAIVQSASTTPSKPSAGLFTTTAGPNKVDKAAGPTQSSTFKVPSFGTPSGTSFMSQFGQNAKKTEEEMAQEAKAKRKADEYDSDDSEDDEEAWERKYDEEQRAKKQKIEEAKTNTTFKFVPNKAPGNNTKDTGSTSVLHQPAAEVSASNKTSGPSSVLQTSSGSHWENPWANLKPQGNNETHVDEESESSDEDEPELQASKIEAALASDASSTSTSRSLFDRIETNSDGSVKRADATLSGNKQNETSRSVGVFGQPSTLQSTSPTSLTAPRSGLFDQPFPNSQTTGIFGTASDRSPNPNTALKNPQLNNTWSVKSPIKFGGASTVPNLSFTSPSPAKPTEQQPNASPFSTLFGAAPASMSFGGQSATFGASMSSTTPTKEPVSIFATTPKTSPPVPTVGFQFGTVGKPFGSLAAPSSFTSATSSRATSPGISTGGDSVEERDEEDGPADAQIDLASARAGEENEDCLLEVKAKSLELQEKKWVKRGVGPLRILKNRSTGRVRIVHRVETVGKIILNAALMDGMTYKHAADKTVTFGVATGTGGISQWSIMVGLKEKAAELTRLLEANKANR